MIARIVILILLASYVLDARIAHAVGLSERNAELMALFQEFDWQNEFWANEFKLERARRLEEGPVEDDGKQSNRRLIRKLKKDPYSFGYGPIGRILASRGSAVAPELIDKLQKADGYFLTAVLNILCDIPSEMRDRAFVARLEEELITQGDFLRRIYIPNMMMALAVNEATDAVAIIQRFARADSEMREIRAMARISLNILGQPEELLSPDLNYTLLDAAAEEFSHDDLEVPFKVLEALLAHGLLNLSATVPPSGTYEIAAVQKGSDTIELSGNLPDDKGTWSLVVGKSRNGRIPIYYEWHTGPLAAAGYTGVLERQDDELRVIHWAMIWIS